MRVNHPAVHYLGRDPVHRRDPAQGAVLFIGRFVQAGDVDAIERGQLREIRPDLARRYFHFLAIEAWVARWCRANRELARRGSGGEAASP